MTSFLDALASVNKVINDFVWVKIGLIVLIGTGILMTCATKWFQISHLKHWWKNTIGSLFKKDVHKGGDRAISPFQALCTALAATIGTGNIAGVAAAICIGGAGAVFWMWLAAFFGMMTNYSENVLGIFYRRRNSDGEWAGGAMYYLADGLGSKKGCKQIGKILAVLFSIFTVLASFGIGSMGQVNKIVLNIKAAFPVESAVAFGGADWYAIIIGLALVALAAAIVCGGLKRIASFAERVVPFMVVLFIIGSLVVIGVNYQNILPAFKAIFVNAFQPVAALGGGIGFVISTVVTEGFKKGVFSNEAGLGSSVMVHSNSSVKEPVIQGMWGIFEVFQDTIIVCTMTALVVLTSGVYDLETGVTVASDATLVAEAFNSVFGFWDIGEKFVAIAMLLFAFTTVLGWNHYGCKAWEYLFGTKTIRGKLKPRHIYKAIHVLTIMLGALMSSSLAWDISDTFNGLMMIPNLIGVIVLCPLVAKITKNYVDRKLKCISVKPMLSYDAELQEQAEKDL